MTADELAQLVLRLHLLDEAQLDDAFARAGTRSDADELLRVLENSHLLTSYQVSRLARGEANDLLLGEYKLLYRNASGSFARVFRACSIKDGRMVGLKLLRQRWASDPATVAQFKREAQVGQKLKHPNIVPIYEVGSQGDYHYFTMEFVEGGNLRDFMAIRRHISAADAARCTLDILQALDYALQRGVTHRDMKPTNVLMSTAGVAKLVDFGLAGDHAGEGEMRRTSMESMQQALEYSTLEKATAAPRNDPRSDLYFVGAILYELLCGTPPYPRTRSRDERRDIARYRNVRPIRSVDPNVPQALVRIVERMMKLDPAQRYQRPGEAIADLQVAMKVLGEEVPASPQAVVEEAPGATRTLPTVMCIESRKKQQDMLREYLSKRGFRVLVLSDLQRGLNRMRTNPPDCVVLMGESIGNGIVEAYQQTVEVGRSASAVTIAILSAKQAERQEALEQNALSRVMVQPVTLRDVRREIHLAFQRRRRGLTG